MDGSSKEEEDSAFTNISLADDKGKEEPNEFKKKTWQLLCSFFKYNFYYFYYNGKTYSL